MFANFHYCPICKTAKIYRKEVRTCGSLDCVSLWRAIKGASVRAQLLTDSFARAERDIIEQLPDYIKKQIKEVH